MINRSDRAILRELGRVKAEQAAHPANARNIALWTATNDLQPGRPPVYINEIPWNEMNVDGELTLRCEGEAARKIETALRRESYLFRHMPANMVVSGHIECPFVLNDSGFGIEEAVDIAQTDATSAVVSRHFHIQIHSADEIEMIKDPVIVLDREASQSLLSGVSEVFEGILPVVQTGLKGYWFTPWDYLIRLTGIEEALIDLYDRPEYIKALVKRFVDASMVRLHRYGELGVWASNNNNTRVGSGGYGYTCALPAPEGLPSGAPTGALWGCGNAQIFSGVSPDMHWEFSLQHEMRWLESFGLTYYGCCEPLSGKMDILKRIPNLRKISMSPWANLRAAAEQAQGRYVLSCKPNPAIFACKALDIGEAKRQLAQIRDEAQGQPIEIIMKDISTVSYAPQNLWKWAELALEFTERYFG